MPKKKIVFVSVGIVAVLLAAFVLFGGKSSAPNQSSNTGNTGSSGTSSAPATGSESFSAAEVATHNSASDCWTIINGDVYDITSYVPRHPGGTEILLACGKDGTTLFTKRTTSDGKKIGSGTPHDSESENQLARLKIGTLKQ